MTDGQPRYKYPRTPHLPWSPGRSSDDIGLEDLSHFAGKQVVVTEKMDGESFTGYSDGYCHARSIDGRHHSSRDWVKNLWSAVQWDLPQGWRICGENLYARHSIEYTALPSYFLGFSIWNEHNRCLSWQHTMEWFNLLRISPVPTLYKGIYDQKLISNLYCDKTQHHTSEGYVVRLAQEFSYEDFGHCVAKFVRPRHVTTETHWMHAEIVPNKLREYSSV